jgi:hypothetical protein
LGSFSFPNKDDDRLDEKIPMVEEDQSVDIQMTSTKVDLVLSHASPSKKELR